MHGTVVMHLQTDAGAEIEGNPCDLEERAKIDAVVPTQGRLTL